MVRFAGWEERAKADPGAVSMPAGVHAQHSQELGSIPRRKRSALQAGSLAAGPGRAAHWLPQAGVTIVLRGRADGRQGRDSGVGSEAARPGPGVCAGTVFPGTCRDRGLRERMEGKRGAPACRVARRGSRGRGMGRGGWGKRNRGRTTWEGESRSRDESTPPAAR